MKETKTKNFALRLKPSLYDKAVKKAVKDRRSVNEIIEFALEEYLPS